MLLLTKKPIHQKAGTGDFFCPSCESNRLFERFDVFDGLTLYGLTLRKGKTTTQYLKCKSCQSLFHPDVLSISIGRKPDAMLPAYNAALKALGANVLNRVAGDESKKERLKDYLVRTTAAGTVSSKAEYDAALIEGDQLKKAAVIMRDQLNVEARDTLNEQFAAMMRLVGQDERQIADHLKTLQSHFLN